MRFIFGLSLLVDRFERVLLGVVGVNRGELVNVLPVTAVVIGDTVDATVGEWTKLGGSTILFPATAFSRARRTAICFAGSLLSAKVNLAARIASGIDASWQHILNVTDALILNLIRSSCSR